MMVMVVVMMMICLRGCEGSVKKKVVNINKEE